MLLLTTFKIHTIIQSFMLSGYWISLLTKFGYLIHIISEYYTPEEYII